jgi:uncharacterized protein
MILGRLIGKLTTATFQFEVTSAAKKFQYVQVYHKEYDYVLCQITELIRDEVRTIAKCNILGNYDGSHIRPIRTPFDPSSEVLDADPEFIRKLMGSESSSSIFIGTLEDNGIPVYLDINELLSKHIAILAKSGSGKSYTVGVLLEELMEKHIPLLVIDTHGEYAQLREQNDSNDDIIALQKLGLLPKAFRDSIQEYGSIETNSSLNPLRLNIAMSGEELISMLPLRLSSAQLALLYGMENTGSFEDMLLHIQHAENPQKFSLINAISFCRSLRSSPMHIPLIMSLCSQENALLSI